MWLREQKWKLHNLLNQFQPFRLKFFWQILNDFYVTYSFVINRFPECIIGTFLMVKDIYQLSHCAWFLFDSGRPSSQHYCDILINGLISRIVQISNLVLFVLLGSFSFVVPFPQVITEMSRSSFISLLNFVFELISYYIFWIVAGHAKDFPSS